MLINSVEDHVHILFELARTVSVSKAVEEVKKASSKWIKTQGDKFADFAWQDMGSLPSANRMFQPCTSISPVRLIIIDEGHFRTNIELFSNGMA